MAVTATRRARELLHIARAAGVALLTDGQRIGLRGPAKAIERLRPLVQAAKPELLALLREAANDPAKAEPRPAGARPEAARGLPPAEPKKSIHGPENAPGAARTCATCAHQTRAGTCGDPVRAGLRPHFGIVWPDPARAATCPAYAPRQRPAGPPKPARWDHDPASSDEIERMAERWERAKAAGLSDGEAGRLADALLLRDRGAEDRHSCLECPAIRAAGAGWWCSAQRLPLARQFVTGLHRCLMFFSQGESEK